ncbi:unnamed protein product [Sphenostylis stenocarpa]|uniref:Uncharacterized protein n=1 Tax=Sphenostylis stenocarpa TaxID=92480 RepID=A0AA86W0T9_9FABA|nr:unnamed protein product [Sphenostylis stenocarpa]
MAYSKGLFGVAASILLLASWMKKKDENNGSSDHPGGLHTATPYKDFKAPLPLVPSLGYVLSWVPLE